MPAPDVTANETLVTVGLPMYNAARTLRTAVASVLWQSHANLELLLIDDGSRDETWVLASAFRDRRIRLLRNDRNRGLAWTLNRAIDEARGVLFARMDADDICYPERLAQQVAYLAREPRVDLLGTRAIAFRDDGSPRGLLPFRPDHAAICARPWATIPMPHPTWMGRIAWFRRHRYRQPEPVRAEDQELLLRARMTSCYACLPEVLLGYRHDAFSLRRQLRARRSLAAVHWRTHAGAGQLPLALLAVGFQAMKTAADAVAALPGLSSLYFSRFSESLAADDRSAWAQVWQRAGAAARQV